MKFKALALTLLILCVTVLCLVSCGNETTAAGTNANTTASTTTAGTETTSASTGATTEMTTATVTTATVTTATPETTAEVHVATVNAEEWKAAIGSIGNATLNIATPTQAFYVNVKLNENVMAEADASMPGGVGYIERVTDGDNTKIYEITKDGDNWIRRDRTESYNNKYDFIVYMYFTFAKDSFADAVYSETDKVYNVAAIEVDKGLVYQNIKIAFDNGKVTSVNFEIPMGGETGVSSLADIGTTEIFIPEYTDYVEPAAE